MNSEIVSPATLNAVERPVTSWQLATHLQVSRRTLATYRAKGRIPFTRAKVLSAGLPTTTG